MCCPNAATYELAYDTYCHMYHQLGINVFTWNYRGYGRSEGSPTITHLRSDGTPTCSALCLLPQGWCADHVVAPACLLVTVLHLSGLHRASCAVDAQPWQAHRPWRVHWRACIPAAAAGCRVPTDVCTGPCAQGVAAARIAASGQADFLVADRNFAALPLVAARLIGAPRGLDSSCRDCRHSPCPRSFAVGLLARRLVGRAGPEVADALGSTHRG